MSTIPVANNEYGTTTLTGGTTLATVTLDDAVNEDQAILLFSASGGSDNIGRSSVAGEILPGGTQIKFKREEAGSGSDFTIEWQVVEFDSSVSFQHITKTITNQTEDTTINAVDLARTIVISNGIRNGGGAYGDDDEVRASLTSTTNLRLEVTSASNQIVSVQVVQFPANAVASVEYVSGSTSALDVGVTISSVDVNKSLIFGSGKFSGTVNGMNDVYGIRFTDETTLNLFRRAGGGTWNYGIFIIQFTDYDVIHRQDLSTPNSVETEVLGSAPSAGSAILGTLSCRPYMGGGSNSDDNVSQTSWSALLSGSTWTFTRANTSNNADLMYSIIDWGQSGASSGPTLTGQDSAIEGSTTQATGDDLDTVTTFSLIAAKISPLTGEYEKEQTIDDQDVTTLDYVPETGQKEARDAAGFTAVNSVPMTPTILSAGAAAHQLKQKADDGTDFNTRNITINQASNLHVAQTMIADADTDAGMGLADPNIVVIEDQHQVAIPKTVIVGPDTITLTLFGDFTYEVDKDITFTFKAIYFSPATGQNKRIDITHIETGVVDDADPGIIRPITRGITRNITK